MNALSIAFKDLKILLRDRGLVLQLFLLPLLFIVAFSIIMSLGGDEQAISVPVVNLDGDGEVAQGLLEGLKSTDAIEVVDYGSEQEAMAALDAGEIARILTIPAGFSADVGAGRRTALELVNSPDASAEQTAAVQEVVGGVATTVSRETQLLEAFRQMDQMMAMAEPEYRVFNETTIEQQARSQFEGSRQRALVSAVMKLPKSLVGEKEELGTQVTVAGFMVLFVFLTAQATAQSIYDEKKVGSFRRLLAAPMSKAELLTGKMIPNFIVTLAQIAVILAAGVFLFPLLGMEKLTLGNDALALIVLSVMVALCSSGLGVLIAALARTESQVGSISSVGLWVMGALGGAFMPTFLLGGFMETISKVVPHSWAATAYYDLLLRGKGIADIGPELAVLAGFTLVFAVIGIWRFEFDS
jgi:ABC-2 type transport system permease protein